MPGQFSYPEFVATDLDGNVYVSDGRNERMQVFRPDGGFILSWKVAARGIDVTSKGYVHVAGAGNNRVAKYMKIGDFVGAWGVVRYGEGAV